MRQDMKLGAPALITLKRWSASGLLDEAKIIPDGALRAKYRYDHVLIVAKRYTRIKPIVQHRTLEPITLKSELPLGVLGLTELEMPPVKSQEEGRAVDTEKLSKSIADELSPMIEKSVASIQKQMLDGLANLDATRKSLMLKYDAELHYLRERVAHLTSENRRLSMDVVDASKLNIRLSKIQESIDFFKTNHEN